MKQNLNKMVILLFLFSIKITAIAQPSEPGYPAGLLYHLPLSNLPIVNLPYFNNETLIAADTCAECGEGYGVDANSSFDFWEMSQIQIVENLYDKVEIYRIKVLSPSAKALHVIFDQFKLSENELMFIYSPNDTNRILGAYSMHNNKSDLSFISNRIGDKELIIELNRRPKVQTNIKGIIKVGRFIHVYKDRLEFENSLNCHENVICAPWYNEWCNQIRSVIKLLRHKTNEGWFLCSGAIVNNLNNNFEPLILTANHCVSNGDDHANWTVFFNFQSITCNPSKNGNDLMTVSGMDVIAIDIDASSCPDIALMRLRQEIPLQYNVFFSGWNRRAWSSLPSDGRGIGIHHPAGDVKKISEGYRVNPLLSSCIKVNYTTGYTEGGSSGSPLFVTSKEIIGVLSWNYIKRDNCNDDANFFYSWLHKSWGALSPHLAPGNEEALTHNGLDPISVCQPIINLNRRFFPGNDWQVKNQITIQAAQRVNIANVTETTMEKSPFNFPSFHSDYIIRAGSRISISPGFKINAPYRYPGTGIYASGFFPQGNQNRVKFQIISCTPFVDDCGFNHENSFVVPNNSTKPSYLKFESSKLINLYPSPTNTMLNIETQDLEGEMKISIQNTIGQIIFSEIKTFNKEFTHTTINTSDFTSGIYFLSIYNKDGHIVEFKKFSIIQ